MSFRTRQRGTIPRLAYLTAALLLASAVPRADAATYRIIAKEGDQLGGGSISRLEPPCVNDAGKVAFSAAVSSTGDMIVVADPQGALAIVAKAGDIAAGTTNAEFLFIGRRITIINEAGQVLFDGSLEDGVGDASDAAKNREGIWLSTGASLALAARDNSPIPDVSNLQYDIAYAEPVLDDGGRVAFLAYSRGKTQNTEVPDSIVLGTPPDAMHAVDSAGQGFDDLMLTPSAGGFWTAATGVGAQREYFVRTSNGLTPTTLWKDGDPAPVGNTFHSVEATGVNAAGTYVGAAFVGTAPPDYWGVFTGQGTSQTLIAKSGDVAPGGAGTFSNIFAARPFLIADSGEVAFLAGASQATGLFRGTNASLSALAVDGQPAGGLPTDITYSGLYSEAAFAMNSSGQVAFLSVIAGPGIPEFSRNQAIFLADTDGSVALIARAGDGIAVAPNDVRVIKELAVANTWFGGSAGGSGGISGGSDGRPRWLDDSGNVAFLAEFDGGSSAVIVAAAGGGAPTATPTGGVGMPTPTATPGFDDAAPRKCRAAIASAVGTLLKAEAKATGVCRAKIVAGKLPPGTVCRSETKTADAITKAQAKLRSTIAKACGGKDKTCGAGSDDIALALLGWNVGTCPNAKGAACANAIGNCEDITTCVTCIDEALVDRVIGLASDALAPTDPKDKAQKALNKCQAAIGKAARGFLDATTRALTKCWTAVNAGKAAGTCPAADGKAVNAIAKAETKKVAAICKACGGADKACDGAGDFALGAIGFAPTCPDVTPPDGASCAGTPATLQDLVSCVGCVTTFSAICAADAAVPGLASYPSNCRP